MKTATSEQLNGIWNSVYDNMRNMNNIISQSEANNEQNYKGIALVMRAWMFSLATDAYGDIPYSEAIRQKRALIIPITIHQKRYTTGF